MPSTYTPGMAQKVWTASEMERKGGKRRAEVCSRQEIAGWGAQGGQNRAARYSKGQIRAWGKLGGRPAALTAKQARRIAEWTRQGIGQETIAERLGVSMRTVGRYLSRLHNGGIVQ
jgi:transposase